MLLTFYSKTNGLFCAIAYPDFLDKLPGLTYGIGLCLRLHLPRNFITLPPARPRNLQWAETSNSLLRHLLDRPDRSFDHLAISFTWYPNRA